MPTPLIVGGDLSSKSLAFVAKHPITPTAMVVKYEITGRRQSYSPQSSYEAMASTMEYLNELKAMAGRTSEKIAYLEGPLVGSTKNIQTTIKQSFVNGVVQAVLVSAGFKVTLVPVGTWKKAVCGNGAADKELVAQTVKNLWPKVHVAADGDQDLLDAAAICLYGAECERRRFSQ